MKLVEQGKAILLDVREKSEWEAGHFKLAQHAPLSSMRKQDALAELVKTLPINKPIYCHCRAGVRAQTASKLLKDNGLRSYGIRASYKDLKDSGYVEVVPKD